MYCSTTHRVEAEVGYGGQRKRQKWQWQGNGWFGLKLGSQHTLPGGGELLQVGSSDSESQTDENGFPATVQEPGYVLIWDYCENWQARKLGN